MYLRGLEYLCLVKNYIVKITVLLLFVFVIIEISKGQSLVVKGNSDEQRIDYVLSRYYLTIETDIRDRIYKDYLNPKKRTEKYASLEWKLIAFSAYDSLLSQNYSAASRLVEEAGLIRPQSAYAKLAVGCISSAIKLKLGKPDLVVSELEPLVYTMESFSDSALHYYSFVILSNAYKELYDAPNMAKWAESALGIKVKALYDDITYKDYRFVGLAYDRNENIDSALYCYNLSKQISEEQNDSVGLFMSNMDLGIFLSERGDRTEALIQFSECEKYLSAVSLRTQAAFHINCNIDYRKVERLKIARDHLVEAERLGLQINDVDILGHVYQNWVAQYGQEGLLDSVPKYIKKSEQLFLDSDNQYGLGYLYHDKGHYYDNIGNLDSALYWYREAEKCFEKINYGGGIHSSRIEEFITLINFKKFDKAKELGESLLEPSREANDLADVMDLQLRLSKIYKAEGDFKKALNALIEANSIQDSLEGAEAKKKVSLLHIKAEQSKRIQLEKERAQDLQLFEVTTKELAFEKRLKLIILISLIVVIISLIFVLGFWYQSKKARVKLEKLDLQKDDLMHVVAHDLLSPIGKVGALAQLMRMTEDESEKEQYLDYLDGVVEESSAMVQNLMDIHSFENNKVALYKQNHKLSELVEDALIGHVSKAEKKDIRIHETVQKDTTIFTDGRMVKRILDNLIGNAIKFSPNGSEVKIEALVNDGLLTFKIEDQGPGFSEEDKHKAFGKFSRLSARPTGEESSTGLGLAIVKELSSQLNGKIDLISEEGKGAKFIIEIPLG